MTDINKLADSLISWAQNEEMIDQYYTEHGVDCNAAAKLLKDLQLANLWLNAFLNMATSPGLITVIETIRTKCQEIVADLDGQPDVDYAAGCRDVVKMIRSVMEETHDQAPQQL